MNKKRVLLNVKRYKQHPSECGIASAASLANYYDPSVEYRDLRQMLPYRKRKDGIFSSQQGRLLNDLGFCRVTIVTADLSLIDFSWRRLSKPTLTRKLKSLAAYHGRCRNKYQREYVLDVVDWLSDKECDNRLIIDWDFAKHIRRGLDSGRPVGAAISWTSFFKVSKFNHGENDPIRGEGDDHAIVLRGYDDEGVFVVDPHHELYRGRLKRYRKGYYKIPWEKFLVNIPQGDLIIIE